MHPLRVRSTRKGDLLLQSHSPNVWPGPGSSERLFRCCISSSSESAALEPSALSAARLTACGLLQFKRKSTTGISYSLFALVMLGNTLYGVSVLLKNPDPGQAEGSYVIHHLPWLVGSLGVLSLDVIVSFLRAESPGLSGALLAATVSSIPSLPPSPGGVSLPCGSSLIVNLLGQRPLQGALYIPCRELCQFWQTECKYYPHIMEGGEAGAEWRFLAQGHLVSLW